MLKKLFITTILFQTLLLVLQLGLTFTKATDGDLLVEIESKITMLEKENDLLSTGIEEATTVHKIQVFSHAQGMIPAQLSSLGSVPVAIRPQSP